MNVDGEDDEEKIDDDEVEGILFRQKVKRAHHRTKSRDTHTKVTTEVLYGMINQNHYSEDVCNYLIFVPRTETASNYTYRVSCTVIITRAVGTLMRNV